MGITCSKRINYYWRSRATPLFLLVHTKQTWSLIGPKICTLFSLVHTKQTGSLIGPKGCTLLSLVQIFGFFSSSFISTLKKKHWPSQEFSSLDGPKIGSFFSKEKSKKAILIFHWSIQMTNVFSLVPLKRSQLFGSICIIFSLGPNSKSTYLIGSYIKNTYLIGSFSTSRLT